MPSTATLPPPIGDPPTELHAGDRLTQPEFHAIYERMPKHIRAELIGGIVYMVSPMKLPHGTHQSVLAAVLTEYENATPGTQHAESTTVILDGDNEPQPDHLLRVLPDFGGNSTTSGKEYIEGTPEFVVEVSDSTRSVDLNSKKREYETCGVLEYVVWSLRDSKFHWFDLSDSRPLRIDSDGVVRSITFPGLWIDTSALTARNVRQGLATLDRGLATPEHAAFAAKLAAAKR